MCTSDSELCRRNAKTALVYLLLTIFCALFGAVYELLSCEVYSFFMLYAFLVPLLGGALPYVLLSLRKKARSSRPFSAFCLHAGNATLTVGSIVGGVLEMYGTSNRLAALYWWVGAALWVLAGVGLTIRTRR